MEIQLNGEAMDTQEDITVGALLSSLDVKPESVAILLNHSVLPRATYNHTVLTAADCLELITYAGGG